MKALITGGKEKVHSSIKVFVHMPKSLAKLLVQLSRKLDTEYSVILYGDITPYPPIHDKDEEATVTITDYYIPKQSVSSAYVDILEPVQPIRNGKRVLGTVHKHPSGITSFSYTDHEYTNSKFPFNLLFVPYRSYYDYPYYHYYPYTSFWHHFSVVRKKEMNINDDDVGNIERSITQASIWCLEKQKILEQICDVQIERGNGIEIKPVMNGTGEIMLVSAVVCYTNNITVELYEDEKVEQVDKLIEEALKNIEGMTTDYQNKFEQIYDKEEDDNEEEKEEKKKNRPNNYHNYHNYHKWW